MLLGLAIGDALGNTSEGMTPDERRRRYGVIRDYLPNRHTGWRAVGLPSDDSQLALWTLEQLNADRRFIPEHLAQRFAHQEIYGIGKTVRQFLVNYKDRGLPWYESGVPSAGNGALMRIAPLVIPYVRRPSSLLWVDTILAAAITHNDAASTASCAAFVAMLWDLLGMDRASARMVAGALRGRGARVGNGQAVSPAAAGFREMSGRCGSSWNTASARPAGTI